MKTSEEELWTTIVHDILEEYFGESADRNRLEVGEATFVEPITTENRTSFKIRNPFLRRGVTVSFKVEK